MTIFIFDRRRLSWRLIILFALTLLHTRVGLAAGAVMDSPEADENQSMVHYAALLRDVNQAIQHDPWLVRSRYQEESLDSLSESAASLPDPKVSIGLANIPVDGFDFNQEPMSQIKLGYTQMIPQGDSLQLKSQQLKQLAMQHPMLRLERQAKVVVAASRLWFEIFESKQSINLIEKNRSLFEQLADIAQASYSSTVGKTQQQDIIRAQLELTRLEDRLTRLRQRQLSTEADLAGYTSEQTMSFAPELSEGSESAKVNSLSHYMLVDIPQIKLAVPLAMTQQNANEFVALINQHPAIAALDKTIQSSLTAVELEKQKYSPNWGVNASYGYRDKDLAGKSRADFFSIGVTFDLPIFTENKQDKQVAAAIATSSANKTEKFLQLKRMMASLNSLLKRLSQLEQRQDLFQQRLLPQMREQAEAALTAYTNDEGDFSEVVRARIAELNAELDALNIAVDIQQTTVAINYFAVKADTQSIVHRMLQRQETTDQANNAWSNSSQQ